MNVMRPLLAFATPSANPCASNGTAGLLLSQLVNIRYSAAIEGAVEMATASTIPVPQRAIIGVLPRLLGRACPRLHCGATDPKIANDRPITCRGPPSGKCASATECHDGCACASECAAPDCAGNGRQ